MFLVYDVFWQTLVCIILSSGDNLFRLLLSTSVNWFKINETPDGRKSSSPVTWDVAFRTCYIAMCNCCLIVHEADGASTRYAGSNRATTADQNGQRNSGSWPPRLPVSCTCDKKEAACARTNYNPIIAKWCCDFEEFKVVTFLVITKLSIPEYYG